MDSKTRAKLRSLSNSIKPSVIIGKEGITENVVKQTEMNLTAHELIKISVLDDEADCKALLETLCEKTKAEPISTIGKKLIMYRYSSKKGIKHALEVKGD